MVSGHSGGGLMVGLGALSGLSNHRNDSTNWYHGPKTPSAPFTHLIRHRWLVWASPAIQLPVLIRRGKVLPCCIVPLISVKQEGSDLELRCQQRWQIILGYRHISSTLSTRGSSHIVTACSSSVQIFLYVYLPTEKLALKTCLGFHRAQTFKYNNGVHDETVTRMRKVKCWRQEGKEAFSFWFLVQTNKRNSLCSNYSFFFTRTSQSAVLLERYTVPNQAGNFQDKYKKNFLSLTGDTFSLDPTGEMRHCSWFFVCVFGFVFFFLFCKLFWWFQAQDVASQLGFYLRSIILRSGNFMRLWVCIK